MEIEQKIQTEKSATYQCKNLLVIRVKWYRAAVTAEAWGSLLPSPTCH